jgi:hypothetical protein
MDEVRTNKFKKFGMVFKFGSFRNSKLVISALYIDQKTYFVFVMLVKKNITYFKIIGTQAIIFYRKDCYLAYASASKFFFSLYICRLGSGVVHSFS